jgi:hypothetical protein
MKPGWKVKKRGKATNQLFGVKGDGVHRKNRQGTWETRQGKAQAETAGRKT